MAVVRPSLILAIDPGTDQSGVVTYDTRAKRITYAEVRENGQLACYLRVHTHDVTLVLEEFQCYGMAVGYDVLRAVRWSGYFEGCWEERNPQVVFLPRRDVKLHLCQSARAKDGNIRQALIDKFGGKQKAIGTKKAQGPLYGLKSHLWAALALAVTYHETRTT